MARRSDTYHTSFVRNDVKKRRFSLLNLIAGLIKPTEGDMVSNAKRIFARYAKVGLADYYHRAVAQYACERLCEGATVAEVAATLGFSDANYFSVFYKRIMGESPRNHKKSNL